MEFIKSRLENFTDPLHIIIRKEDFTPGRKDIVDPSEYIQCAILNLNSGKTFRPHKHIPRWNSPSAITQEAWVVITGSVLVMYYDMDEVMIANRILHPGDCTITLDGGHNYEILEDNTLVYEFKTGPYKGQEIDKAFLKETW